MTKQEQSENVTKPKPMNYLNPLSYMPSYKTNLLFKKYNFSLYSTTVDTSMSDRPKMEIGRCDNLNNYEITSKKVCVATSIPDPIVWTMDVENIPELSEVSLATKEKITNESKKYIVTIPWATYKQEGMHYYPDCSKAKFADGTSAAKLFTENGTRSCEKKVIPRTINGSKIRAKYMSDKYVSLDTYLPVKKNPQS